ncbi:hypothetical protein DOTSEDRAFT_70386 [Dothistroma septosporum NZE10]|uniref:ASST-domain-containing protein n=1 Tax=Dothistroma septosporum (strain NZE10 / CBS 128990) TaxID=675120 RepID=N1PVC8_DOTSN|nr:hypothetical protein DOTSEDRAFT_70386 [Dothistroma septosporum NZE10]
MYLYWRMTSSQHQPSQLGRVRIWTCLVFTTLLSNLVGAQLNNDTSPTYQFKSRPDLHAPIIDFAILRPELVTPGYIFFAPFRNIDPGPYIYDNYGNLVWSAAGRSGPKTAHAPKVCTYKGTDHLCYFHGEQHQGFARGQGIIMDQSYRVVKTVESSGAGASSDMHEFKITPYSNGTTALMTVYQPRQYDLTTNPRFNLQGGLGWVVEGVFQEVEIETGRVVFEWRSLDHVDPSQAWTLPGTTDTSGDGLHEQSPWDYFHINSIDKNEDGDYLISARHVSAIYKVSGKDGSIIWSLGGNSPTVRNTNFQFSYQHHARWITENSTHTTFSFFDNASNAYNGTGDRSHGWIISIDHDAKAATMIKEWGAPEPEGGLLSSSQGNMQLLSNGRVHIGWGEHAHFSEHMQDGTCVQYGKVADRASNVMIYRSNKFNWTAQPVEKPALWTYSRLGAVGSVNEPGSMSLWVSWNGATEVSMWNFYVSESASGPWEYAGTAKKDGFETEYALDHFAPWSYAEALDSQGRPLDASVIAKTFVPSLKLRQFCGDRGCEYAERVRPEEEIPYEAESEVAKQDLSPSRGFNTNRYYVELPISEDMVPGLDADVEDEDEEEYYTVDGRKTTYNTRTWSSGSTTVAAGAGVMVGFATAMITFFLWKAGPFRKVKGKTSEVREEVAQRRFGSGTLGQYMRVGETDGFESGYCSSSGMS